MKALSASTRNRTVTNRLDLVFTIIAILFPLSFLVLCKYSFWKYWSNTEKGNNLFTCGLINLIGLFLVVLVLTVLNELGLINHVWGFDPLSVAILVMGATDAAIVESGLDRINSPHYHH